MDDERQIEALRLKVESLAASVDMLSVETSVLQELCAALMAELAVQDEHPSQRLEQIISDEQQMSYMVALDLEEHGDDLWDILVSHAEIRNRAFDHARMALARIMGTH